MIVRPEHPELSGPFEPILVEPADGAEGVSACPTLAVLVSDPEGDSLTVTWRGRRAVAPPGPDFGIVALPDAQFYTAPAGGGTPEILRAQTEWAVAQATERNIAFLTQLGDIVENGDNGGNPCEWENARMATSVLEVPGPDGACGLPYEITVGNHEQTPRGDPEGTTTFYNLYYGTTHFAGRPYYGGHYGQNNDDHLSFFSASGLDFVVLSLEFDQNRDPGVLHWADSLLTLYSDRRAILVTHYLIHPGFPGKWGTAGEALYNGLRQHPNLFVMLCGHISGEGRREEVYDGRTTEILLSNYQNRENGGNGWLRLLEFSPAQNNVRVRTYSPTLDQWETDSDSEFSFPYDMTRPGDWEEVAFNLRVGSGTVCGIPWPDRYPLTAYEWSVTVSDGESETAGPVWRFTTGNTTTLTVTTDGGGTVQRDPDLPEYDTGTPVLLQAEPDAGWNFTHWDGDLQTTENPVMVVVDRPMHACAHFLDVQPPLIEVRYPNGGEELLIGGDQFLRWWACDNGGVTAIDVALSRSGPDGPFEDLAVGIPDGGWFRWHVVGPETNQGYVRVTAYDAVGNVAVDASDRPFRIHSLSSGLAEASPRTLSLAVYPGEPLAGSGVFFLGIPRGGPVRLALYDCAGREAAVLSDRDLPSGTHRIGWDGRISGGIAPSGVYFLRLCAPGAELTHRMVYVR